MYFSTSVLFSKCAVPYRYYTGFTGKNLSFFLVWNYFFLSIKKPPLILRRSFISLIYFNKRVLYHLNLLRLKNVGMSSSSSENILALLSSFGLLSASFFSKSPTVFLNTGFLSKPVAITVIKSSSFKFSSITAPNIILASGSADF